MIKKISSFILLGVIITLIGCSCRPNKDNINTVAPTDNQEEVQVSTGTETSTGDIKENEKVMENKNLNNNTEQMTVKNGDTIKVDYIGALNDGTVFDTSLKAVAEKANVFNPQRTYEPIAFVVGQGQMIKGFDNGVVGMKVGETKKVQIAPEDGYGVQQQNLFQVLKLGQQLNLGREMASISEITTDGIVLDFNHPLAGKVLNFEIQIFGADNEGEIISGNTVQVNYIGKLSDGKIFDTNIEDIAKQTNTYIEGRPYQPLEFTVGKGQMIKGFDNGVVGMKIGETKNITIEPKDGYGESNKDFFRKIKIGEGFMLPNGQASLSSVSQDLKEATLDFNHPLAGKVLNFEILVKEIN